MLRSAIDWHSTSLKMSFEVSIEVAPAALWRISRRCANRPEKNFAGLEEEAAGLLQETDPNSAPIWCGARSKCQVAALTESRDGRGSKCSAVERDTPSSPLYSNSTSAGLISLLAPMPRRGRFSP